MTETEFEKNWHGCYDESWKDLIVPAAFAHPAKMAYGLTRRIFKHALAESWVRPGDVVVDPFGGIGSTGIVGAHFGLQVLCVKLEQKFVDLAKQNFELHRKSIETFSHFGKPLYPVIIQGDSRNLAEIVGQVELIVSSPPYAGSDLNGKRATPCLAHKAELLERAGIDSKKWLGNKRCTQMRNDGYIGSEGQIGETQGETFWSAARQIASECYKILRPGGYAIWVVKDFVRNKKKVDFTGDWRRLCESVGFETLHIHHAMLVKESRKKSLFGHEIVETKERKGFFRRLAEQKGSQKIDYEVVLCMVKQQRTEGTI